MRPSTYPVGQSWGVTLVAPGSAGVRADLGFVLQVHDESGRCSIAAMTQVHRHNQGRGLKQIILERIFETTIGSAHFDATATAVHAAYVDGIPATLQAVADALDAERRLAGEPPGA
jgi:hypothetical protein